MFLVTSFQSFCLSLNKIEGHICEIWSNICGKVYLYRKCNINGFNLKLYPRKLLFLQIGWVHFMIVSLIWKKKLEKFIWKFNRGLRFVAKIGIYLIIKRKTCHRIFKTEYHLKNTFRKSESF